GVRITSGTSASASGNLVNLPVVASTSPSRRYPFWSLHSVIQSGLWYQMKKMPWSVARAHTIHSDRRDGILKILVQQLAIQTFHVVDEAIERVPGADRVPPGGAHAAPPLSIRQQRDDTIGESLGVAERSHEPDLV